MVDGDPTAGGIGEWSGTWEQASVFVLRPLLAVSFVLSLIFFSWFMAWKTVLVHVPLVQEICGLRKKPVKPKPANRHRISRFYYADTSLRNNNSSVDETSASSSPSKSQ